MRLQVDMRCAGSSSPLTAAAVQWRSWQDGTALDEVWLKPATIDGRRMCWQWADITERKAALAALQAQQQQYRAIFDGSVDSMVLWSQELRTVDVNQAFVRMTGVTREQVCALTERPT
jgi:PAS domain-containing protein